MLGSGKEQGKEMDDRIDTFVSFYKNNIFQRKSFNILGKWYACWHFLCWQQSELSIKTFLILKALVYSTWKFLPEMYYLYRNVSALSMSTNFFPSIPFLKVLNTIPWWASNDKCIFVSHESSQKEFPQNKIWPWWGIDDRFLPVLPWSRFHKADEPAKTTCNEFCFFLQKLSYFVLHIYCRNSQILWAKPDFDASPESKWYFVSNAQVWIWHFPLL